MAKVYVSSTIADLKQERQAVIDWLVAAQHQVVHSYRPDSDTVRDSVLEDVDTCDLYVLILGHRYGFQPSQDNPEGLSITHLEFRRAGQKGKPRVALLRTSIPDVGLSDMADPPRLALVLALREEVTIAVRAAEFGDLRGLVQELSTGVQAELDKIQAKLAELAMAQTERAELAKQPRGPVSVGRALRLAPRSAFLAGRDGLLAELEARLGDGDGREPRVVVLHGLAGAGKTSVALVYAHAHPGAGIMWQFAAEDPAVLATGFTELAAALGVWEGAGDPVVAVHGVLAGAGSGWLLVFDNAPGPEAVEAFMPPVGGGRVLITSRNALWPPGYGLEVPVLDLEAAAGFLAARTGDADRKAAAGLAEAVGGLPLALEQAAAYAQATGNSLAAYLALFHKRRADLLTRGQIPGYAGTVATTWALAFTQLQQSDPEAAGLLRLLAFCAPEAVPLGLLLRPRPGLVGQLSPEVAGVLASLLEDELAAGDAVAALRRYSLARPAGDGAVSVHRLVRAVTTDQMPSDLAQAWRQAAAEVIEAAIPGDPQKPSTWPVFAALLPHARAVVDLTGDGMWQVARYLGYSGSYACARDLFQLIAEADREDGAYGAEHPHTLSACGYLAYWTGEAGDAAGARDQFAALLPVRERVLGLEHRDALNARDYLAHWTGQAGDAAGARDQFAALLPIMERVLGLEHPDTLRTRDNLAHWTGHAGDAAGARDQFAALLPIMERVLGPEHPDTLATRNNLSGWTGNAGDPAGARDQFAALLPVRERVLGPEHPDTLATRNNLSGWTGKAGDPAGARDQFAALLPVRERVLGPEHPDTLATRGDLARCTGKAGDAAAARDQFAALLPVFERVLGPEHPDAVAARGNLAFWTGEAGDAAAARDQFAALLPVFERVSGPEHPESLATRAHIARWTGDAGDPTAARDQFAALLPVRERVSGPEHPDTLATRGDLARWTGKSGDAAAARDQFAALLPVFERVLGPEHPDAVAARGNLAFWTGEAGDAAAARDQFAALLPVFERVSGPEHPESLATRAHIARWTGDAGDPTAARDQFAALLPVRERVSGPEHPDTLAARRNLARWTKQAEGQEGAR